MRIHEASLIRAARDLRDATELFGRHTEALLAVTAGGARSPWGVGAISMVMDRVNESLGTACRHLHDNLAASGAGLGTMAGLHAAARQSALAAVLASAGVGNAAAGATSLPALDGEAGPAGRAPAGGRAAPAALERPAGDEQALMLPPSVETAFGMLGVPWLTQHEGVLRTCAVAYRAFAHALATEIIPAAHHAIGHAGANNSGDAIDDVTAFWADYHHEGDDSGHLSSLTTVLNALADVHDVAARLVAVAKRFLLVLAGLVAAALVWAAIAAVVSGGTAALSARTVIAGLRRVAQRAMTAFRRRLEQLLAHAVVRGVETRLRRILKARGPRSAGAARRTTAQARATTAPAAPKPAAPDTPRTTASGTASGAPSGAPSGAHEPARQVAGEVPPPGVAREVPAPSAPKDPPSGPAKDAPPAAAEETPAVAANEAPPVPARATPPPSAGNASPYDFEPTDPPVSPWGQEQIAKIRESMRSEGWKGRPIFVVHHEDRMFVVDGNHRLRASEGVLDEIPFKEVQLPFMGYRNIKDVQNGWEMSRSMMPDWFAERGRRGSQDG
ncbi:ParB/RepB/Spo0J family partition protein [Nonomuraea indica]|uniref:ParB/RepB/Spo0J family partition protein n=1 Tax=Nonomuraea indica TaxID=1581193 RepID=UPI001182E305|nr:ParB/RepB/Spo0J family partition protein [Nonomuraea indica]